jgi:hypothetical protein
MLEPMTNNQVELMPKLNLLLINLKVNFFILLINLQLLDLCYLNEF